MRLTSPSTLISGGQATKSVLFYNNARNKIGLVGFWDTAAFDEVGGERGGAGQQHEEFRLRLAKEREVELAAIRVQKDVAEAHSRIVGEALTGIAAYR